MTFPAEIDTVPLQRWEDGSIRVGGTRLHFYIVIEAWRDGRSPEQIQEEFPVVTLADVYGAIAYALRHPADTDEHLRLVAEEAARLEAEARRRFPHAEFKERLLARLRNGTTDR